jgi:hypothetical protein
MATLPSATDLKMDPSSLYREEMFTDRKMGAIRVLTPVKSDGTADGTRKTLYVGETQFDASRPPAVFELDAARLADAVEPSPGAATPSSALRREFEDSPRGGVSDHHARSTPGLLGGPGGSAARPPGRRRQAPAAIGSGPPRSPRAATTWRTHRPGGARRGLTLSGARSSTTSGPAAPSAPALAG